VFKCQVVLYIFKKSLHVVVWGGDNILAINSQENH